MSQLQMVDASSVALMTSRFVSLHSVFNHTETSVTVAASSTGHGDNDAVALSPWPVLDVVNQ